MHKNILDHDKKRGYYEPEHQNIERAVEVSYKFYLPEHEHDESDFRNGAMWRQIVETIADEIRTMTKHGHKFPTGDAMLEHIGTMLFNEVDVRRLDLWR